MLSRSRRLKAVLALAVVVAVILIVPAVLSSRRDDYLRRARVCSELERDTVALEAAFHRFEGDDYPDALKAEMIKARRSPDATLVYLEKLRTRKAWTCAMRARYERAARKPWLAVEILPFPE
jgi:hypothetical protein